MRRAATLTIVLCAAITAHAGPSPATLFVDDDSPAMSPDGASWATAYQSLQDALDAASASGGAVTEIRIAQGRYTPDQGVAVAPGDRAANFTMIDGVDIQGGYRGLTGPGSPDDLDTDAFITTLSGDLSANDAGFNNQAENAYQVIRANSLATGITISGLRIEGGNTRGALSPDAALGGGIQTIASTLTITDCDFANSFGGGVYAELATVDISGSTFDTNTTGVVAMDANVTVDESQFVENPVGGIEATGGELLVTGCEFHANRNSAIEILWGTAEITGCLFEDNITTGTDGAGIRADLSGTNDLDIAACDFNRNIAMNNAGGGIYINGGRPNTVTDCNFTENQAQRGGGLSSSRGVARNCRFENNSATGSANGDGGGAETNRVDFYDCVFIGNSAQRRGGGLAMTNNSAFVTPVQRCLFAGNNSIADSGGGLFATSANIYGCVFTGNSSLFRGGGAFVTAQLDLDSSIFYGNESILQTLNGLSTTSNAAIRNSIFWFNGGPLLENQINVAMIDEERGLQFGLFYNCIMGHTPDVIGVANFGANPLIANPEGPDGMLGTEDDDFTLAAGSPCIDAGSNSLVADDFGDLDGDTITAERTPEDFIGNPRFVDDPSSPDTGEGDAPIVDIGPIESDGSAPALCPGDCDGSGTIDFNDLVSILFQFGVGSVAECDADGNGTVNFNDLVATLFLFGPCPN